MNASLKFKFIEKNLSTLLLMMQSSQNFKRYVMYLDDSPLDSGKPDIEQDLVDSGNIILDLYDEEVLSTAETRVFCSPLDGTLETQPLGYDMYTLDILIPKDFWILNDDAKLRAFRIAYEISLKIDGKNIAGIGQVEITKYRIFKAKNGTYGGLTLFIKINTPTIKGS